jgi:hypothetical protein
MPNTPTVPTIDRLGRGFFGVPDPPPGATFPINPKADPWLAWRVAVHEAKTGVFNNLPTLLTLYDPVGDPRFNFQVMILIGEAGPWRCFESIARELTSPSNPIDYEVGLNFSYALAIRGLLADVPLLLAVYRRHAVVEDADIMPVRINGLLSSVAGTLSKPAKFENLQAYEDAVLSRQRELAEAFGSDQVLVLRGERFGVVRLAERLLELLRKPYFMPDLRRKFEAATGIDCTGFYKNGVLQPLAAAEIVEAFLESPYASTYEDGVRYFFGHRIPR